MPNQVVGLSSMATKDLLAELGDALRRDHSVSVSFASAGGVAVARQIRNGTQADLAVLDAATMSELADDGFFVPGTLTPLYVSDVVAAVPEGAPPVSISSQDEVRRALLDAERIAYSTGPSGRALLGLLERWDLRDVLAARLVQAEPGSPVAGLLAGGKADLGFQQRSELSGSAGVRVLGALPGSAAIKSTFSGAVLARSTQHGPAREVLDLLRADDAEVRVRAAGMALACDL
ncbi:substrate-binding domain-containing protein [uncultured Jatrophihabitans sp.]|uniref:substrate-binding domain-containing protein n=1 Tax=uncultured Jatrophihabitans sp. TaxID=1610747 RepID=UPI0035CC213A